MLLVILMIKKCLELSAKKNSKKQIKKNLERKKVIKRKDNKLHVKWKSYDNLFNSWIDKKGIAI